ncbi:PREDICTED: uncharacterized protein LOC106818084 [Priapulus caudatus]|uniref:Uncharacterized protein LOC106818084 n=1 Tax=Priapulus caudatus TaxID=37621 RepID=A0ABM1F1H0_PRICU|nr:PREDICTED: uncharacterized protein LOC106818084 [Priapulus caudatus]
MEINKIPTFDCYSDPATCGPRWMRWLTVFELYADGKGLIVNEDTDNTTKQRRRALLLHSAGLDVQDVFSTLPATGGVTDYVTAVTALNTYFVPQVNSAFARQTFHRITQKPGETVQQFVTRLRKAARDCNFGSDIENQIRDSVLSKCSSDYVRRKLLEEGQALTLGRAIQVADQCEMVEGQMAALSTANSGETVNRIGERSGHWKPQQRRAWSKSDNKTVTVNRDKACYRCGLTGHFGSDPKCPAKGQSCRKCKGKDHFAKVCRTKSRSGVNLVSESPNDPCNSDYAFTVSGCKSSMLTTCVGGADLAMLVDSGATSNIVDEETWEELKSRKIKCKSVASTTVRKLFPYGSDKPLPVKGRFDCVIQAGGKVAEAEFLVIKGKGVPLLGRDTATKLGVLKIGIEIAALSDVASDIQRLYPDVFHGVGKLKTRQVIIHIDHTVPPVAQPLRRTPFNLRDKVDGKIKELLDLDIIEPVDGPTPWVNPVVVVPKAAGDIRLCLDMRRANEAVIRGRYPIPTVDKLLQNMNGSKVFSRLDLKWGYHQLELSPECCEITTFATHSGLYRYKR